VVLPSTFVLYATYRYGWDTTTVGLTLALVGVCAMVVQGAGVGPIVKRSASAAAGCWGSPGCVGILHLWRGPDRAAVLARHSRDGAVGRGGGGDQALTTQLVAPDQQASCRRDQQRQQHRPDGGTVSVTLTFAYFISDQAPVQNAGAPVSCWRRRYWAGPLIRVGTLKK